PILRQCLRVEYVVSIDAAEDDPSVREPRPSVQVELVALEPVFGRVVADVEGAVGGAFNPTQPPVRARPDPTRIVLDEAVDHTVRKSVGHADSAERAVATQDADAVERADPDATLVILQKRPGSGI